ncbi:MAG: hypothetical protein GX653_09920 [Clostridiales bacterium]|nr:hypothetical protein [Clostridiales bacterium]
MQILSPACGITAVPGGAGATRVQVPDDMQPPLHHRWVYQLTDSATPAGKYGTALTAITDLPDGDTDIETGGKGYLHLFLVGPDDKPVKALRLIPQAG